MTTEIFRCPVCESSITEPINERPDMRRCKNCQAVFHEGDQKKNKTFNEQLTERMEKSIAGID